MRSAATIEEVFRGERARVLATAIRVANGDFDLAEEAVQESFAAALARWPSEGTPDEPRAWLVNVARNKAIDMIRRRVKLRSIIESEERREETVEIAEIGVLTDDRLRLIYTCCHPALAAEAQVALTLRTLCGLTTEEIARAFLTSPITMQQRLVRAKSKIKAARIPYAVPEGAELAERNESVMACVYFVFNEGYAATAGDAMIRRDLCGEAIRLARLLVELSDVAEAKGLLALLLLHDSRRDARLDTQGDLVLLEDQDRSRWDRAQIDEALVLVPLALRAGASSYALQAAIGALHAQASPASATDWLQISALYGELYSRYPTPVVALNRAVAIAMARGPDVGLALIDELRGELADYHLWHAARADLLRRLGKNRDATIAYREALALVGSVPERRFLERRLAEVSS